MFVLFGKRSRQSHRARRRNARLDVLKQMTGPGGQFYANQEELAQSLQVWQELFKAAKQLQ